jgi:potassium-transporting ATPase potassium-binding subunit
MENGGGVVDLSLVHPVWVIALSVAGSLPLGWWMAHVLDPPPERVGKGLDAAPHALLRLLGIRQPAKMSWKEYAFALLAFNTALFVLSFAILQAQSHFNFLNPDGKGPLDALGFKDAMGTQHQGEDTALIFNTVCSFVTNTNLQHYSGEQHLSYFSQLAAIVWLQFVTPACGLAAMLAVVRGLRGERELGDFYLDTIRGLCLVLVPLSIIVAVVLVATGVPMTLQGAIPARTVEGATQTIAVGPVAAEVAIKQLGTNGGGFFWAELGPSLRKPEPLEQPDRGRFDHYHPHGLDRDVRADDQGSGARRGHL